MDLEELQRYFLLLDEGMGTAYERYALNRFLEGVVKKMGVRSVLELPCNGVMGVPGVKSMVFAACGCDVTLINPSKGLIDDARRLWDALGLEAEFVVSDYKKTRLEGGTYDLVWNFCVFEHFKDPSLVVGEMARLSRKFVLIEIQNVFDIGNAAHRVYHSLRGERWDHGEMRRMDYRVVSRVMRENGLRVVKVGGTDMPPWPDINMRLSELGEEKAEGSGGLRLNVKTKKAGEIVELWGRKPEGFPLWMKFLELWYKLEAFSPEPVKIFLSHHPYVIGVK
jgi:SAM-dependent methyltransferase